MKRYNFIFLTLVSAASILLSTECTYNKKNDTLKISPSSLKFSAVDDTEKILKVLTNVSDWIFETSDEWYHVQRGVDKLIVTVDEYTETTGSRLGTIIVMAGESLRKTAKIIQYGIDYIEEDPPVDEDDRQIDSTRLKEIIYPPLTAREGLGLTLPMLPAEHPRLFFRKSDLSAIKAKVEHPLLDKCWNSVNQNARYATDGKLIQGVIHNVDMHVVNAIEARAFMYALSGDREMGNEAVDFIFNLHNTLIINPKKGDVCRDIGRIILATAVVYDWCYDLISPVEKKSLIAIMESLAADMEIKWPQLVQGSVVGHGTEAQLLRDLLSCGIAVYNEKPEIYRRAAGRIFAELIPVQNFGYQSGHHHQGSSYGPYRFQWEMYPTLLFDRMGISDLNRPLQGEMPFYWMYIRRPDGQLLRDGDVYGEAGNAFGRYWTFSDLVYVASYYQNPLLMGEAIRQGGIGQTPLYDLLLIDPNVSADTNLSSLPLTRYFPSPFGGMVARTGWDTGISLTSSTVVAEMKISERFFGSHQQLDAGSFQIYYKGPLSVNSGIYEGTEGAWGSSHFRNYYIRTIAHNGMLVYNFGENFRFGGSNVSNDGGQRIPNDPRDLTALMATSNKFGDVLAYDYGPNSVTPEYSYLKGDISAAYTNKVTTHKRAFVFLNLDGEHSGSPVPAALIVHDYVVSSNAGYKKTWLLHCVQEPTFNGNVTTIVRNQKGYNGKLANTTLLPLNVSLTKVGGAGNEFSVGGINYPQSMSSSNNSWDGAIWRVELSPVTASQTDVFLNVMQVTDADNNTLLPVEAIETTQMTGAKIGDRIVLFSKNSTLINTPVNLIISGSGTFKVLITDLEKGNWEITGYQSPRTVRNDNNLVYFEVATGNYVITKK